MAKINWNPWFGISRGSLNTSAVSSIKQPSSPLVFGKNQQSEILYMPKFQNRTEPKGGQVRVREVYCECSNQYRMEPATRAIYRTLAQAYNRSHPGAPQRTGYSHFMAECMKETHYQDKVTEEYWSHWPLLDTMHFDTVMANTHWEYYFLDGQTLQPGKYLLACSGWYQIHPDYDKAPHCRETTWKTEYRVHAWCSADPTAPLWKYSMMLCTSPWVKAIQEVGLGMPTMEFDLPEGVCGIKLNPFYGWPMDADADYTLYGPYI